MKHILEVRRINLPHSSFSAVPRDFAALLSFYKPYRTTVKAVRKLKSWIYVKYWYNILIIKALKEEGWVLK